MFEWIKRRVTNGQSELPEDDPRRMTTDDWRWHNQNLIARLNMVLPPDDGLLRRGAAGGNAENPNSPVRRKPSPPSRGDVEDTFITTTYGSVKTMGAKPQQPPAQTTAGRQGVPIFSVSSANEASVSDRYFPYGGAAGAMVPTTVGDDTAGSNTSTAATRRSSGSLSSSSSDRLTGVTASPMYGTFAAPDSHRVGSSTTTTTMERRGATTTSSSSSPPRPGPFHTSVMRPSKDGASPWPAVFTSCHSINTLEADVADDPTHLEVGHPSRVVLRSRSPTAADAESSKRPIVVGFRNHSESNAAAASNRGSARGSSSTSSSACAPAASCTTLATDYRSQVTDADDAVVLPGSGIPTHSHLPPNVSVLLSSRPVLLNRSRSRDDASAEVVPGRGRDDVELASMARSESR